MILFGEAVRFHLDLPEGRALVHIVPPYVVAWPMALFERRRR